MDRRRHQGTALCRQRSLLPTANAARAPNLEKQATTLLAR